MKVLFVTRNFPPSVGGLQRASFELHRAMAQQTDVKLIKWGGSRYALPLVYPIILLRTLIACWRGQADIVYLQDGVLAVTAVFVKLLCRKPVVITLHGLDINFKLGFYQWLLRNSLKFADRAITASDWSADIIRNKFPGLAVSVIGHGVNDDFFDPTIKRSPDPVLLTTGRLVKRKGVAWFVDMVMPDLIESQPKLQYIVIGSGPMQAKIKRILQEKHLAKNVKLHGRVSQAERNHWYNQADLFVMPNIPVEGDGEGFGLVALEAASCGTPVIGAALEGVKNAVVDRKTGWLVEPSDAHAFAQQIKQQLNKPQLKRPAVRQYVLEHCTWQQISEQYLAVMSDACQATTTGT